MLYIIFGAIFRFEPWDHFKHEEARKKMIQDQKVNNAGIYGIQLSTNSL